MELIHWSSLDDALHTRYTRRENDEGTSARRIDPMLTDELVAARGARHGAMDVLGEGQDNSWDAQPAEGRLVISALWPVGGEQRQIREAEQLPFSVRWLETGARKLVREDIHVRCVEHRAALALERPRRRQRVEHFHSRGARAVGRALQAFPIRVDDFQVDSYPGDGRDHELKLLGERRRERRERHEGGLPFFVLLALLDVLIHLRVDGRVAHFALGSEVGSELLGLETRDEPHRALAVPAKVEELQRRRTRERVQQRALGIVHQIEDGVRGVVHH